MTQPATRFEANRPAPTSLVIDAALVAPGREEFNPRYGAPVWPLIAMSENPSDADVQLHWRGFPAALREQFRHAAWALVNFPVPDELLDTSPAMRARLSVLRIYHTGTYWRIFARWLTARAVTSLDQVTGDHLVDYSRYLVKERRVSRATAINHLVGLSRLHTHGRHYLPADLQIGEPPWLREGLDAYLPAASASGENATEPISPSTMGPLLVWALRFVEDFADDILAAHRERQRLTRRAQQPGDADSAARVRAYLENLKATGEPFPACAYRGGSAGGAGYVAGLLGASLAQVSRAMARPEWVRYREQNPGRCPLAVPVTGAIDGKPWTDGIDYYDAPKLLRHLVSACFIVLAFLMGARTGEVLALEHGCCPDPEEPDSAGPRRHLVYGRQFKSARDEDGNHLSAGVQRETPWATVPQAVTAIRVLEQITETGLLFSTAVHSGRREQRQNGRSLAINTMAGRIEDFIAWVNEHAADGEAIPADPAGKIATSRFRRTLAWHIARQPGGLVALAIQYGHLRGFVSEQYASRSRNGIHELLDFETARAVAEHLSDVAEDLGEGGGVSGPAARRLLQAAAEQQHRFGGIIATPRQACALLADPMLNVFENKDAYLTCNYDPSRALCHPGRGAEDSVPSLERCRVTCANIARTDADAYGLVQEAARLDTEAASPLTPEPVADRLRERARHLLSLAAQHHDQRITLKETDAS